MTEETRHPGCLDANMMAEYIDGGLEPRQRADVESHLAECGACYETFSETVKVSAEVGVAARLSQKVPAPQARARWFRYVAFAAVAVAAVALWSGQAFRTEPPLDAALSELATAVGAGRFAEARLSGPFAWGPIPSPVRGGRETAPIPVQQAALKIAAFDDDKNSSAVVAAKGVAKLATGDVDSAVELLTEAVRRDPTHVAPHVDLSAALLALSAASNEPAHAARALDEAEMALAKDPNNAAALFNRALAIEALGLRSRAVGAWQDFLRQDGNSEWAGEARGRIQKLQKTPETTSLTPQYRELEDVRLAQWARNASGQIAELSSARAAIASLAALPDQWTVAARQAVATTIDPRRQGCLALGLLKMADWRTKFISAQTASYAPLAERAAADLACAGLPSLEADSYQVVSMFEAGDFDRADARARQLIPAARKLNYLRSLARLEQIRGLSALFRAEFSSGVAHLSAAAQAATDAGDLEFASALHVLVSQAYDQQGAVLLSWRHLRIALGGIDQMESPRRRYAVLADATISALDLHWAGAASVLGSTLIESTRSWDNPAGQVLGYLKQAEALHELGKPQAARSVLMDARRLLPTVTPRESAEQFEAFADYAEGLITMASGPAEAAKLLTEALAYFRRASNKVMEGPTLLARGRVAMAAGDATSAEKDWQLSATLLEDQQAGINDAQLRISRLDRSWEVFEELIRLESERSPDAALDTAERSRARQLLGSLRTGTVPPPLSGAALRSWLPDDAAVLFYVALPEKLLIWHITRESANLIVRTIDARALEGMIGDFTVTLKLGQADATPLSALLFPEAVSKSWPQRLLLVPDGPLHNLAFAAVPVANDRTLVEMTIPVIAASLTSAQIAGAYPSIQRPSSLFVGVDTASSDEGLAALPGVRSEMSALQSLYPSADYLTGASATRTAVLKAMRSRSLVHFSGHAVADAVIPARSRLVLVADQSGHALTAPSLAGVRLTKGATVVLAACETGRGVPFRGEGAMSLARPFLSAGASAVVATLWPVRDEPSARFLSSLHQRLIAGVATAVALAQTQRAFRSAGHAAEVWAAFEVVGGLTPAGIRSPTLGHSQETGR